MKFLGMIFCLLSVIGVLQGAAVRVIQIVPQRRNSEQRPLEAGSPAGKSCHQELSRAAVQKHQRAVAPSVFPYRQRVGGRTGSSSPRTSEWDEARRQQEAELDRLEELEAAQGRFVSEAFMEKRIASTQRDVQQKYEALLTHHRDLELEYAERLVVVMHERDELHAQQKRAQEVEHSNQLRASIQSYNAQIESYKDRVTDLEQQVKEAEDRTETFRLLVADAHAMNERLQQQSQLCGWWWRALLCCQCCERSQTLPL